MKILLTGGTGDVGKAAVRRLVERGHSVLVVGRSHGKSLPGADYEVCDVNDHEAFDGLVRHARPDAIVHLAAIRTPTKDPPVNVLRTNLMGTIHVYQAAEDNGVGLVVAASSINAVGFKFGVKPFTPKRLPIDESHSSQTTDPYSFSKETGEAIGAYYWRRSGIRGTGLRLPWVYNYENQQRLRDRLPACAASAARLRAMPESERRRYAREIIDAHDAFRAREINVDRSGLRNLMEREPLLHLWSDFYAVVHEEDSAAAIEQSLVADYDGFHPLFIVEEANATGVQTAFLADTFYPEADKEPLNGIESLVSFERARDLIGYRPTRAVCEARADA